MVNESPTAASLLEVLRAISPGKMPRLCAACLRVLGEATDPTDLQDRLEEVFTDINAYADEIRTLLPTLGDLTPFVDLAYDTRIPLVARKAFCDVMVAVLASLVISVAVDAQRRPEAWLAAALASTVGKGLRALEAGALAILPPLLAGGVAAVEQNFAGELSEARDFVARLESFYSPAP